MMSCIRDLELFKSELLPQHDVMPSGLRIFQLQRNEWTTNFRRMMVTIRYLPQRK